MNKEFIQEILVKSKLSKKDFASKIDVTIITLNNWLFGKSEPNFINQKIIRSTFKNEISTK